MFDRIHLSTDGGKMTKWILSSPLRLLNWLIVTSLNLYSSFTNIELESGEGVISTAIVVLIIAFLAVGMWIAFKAIMGQTTSTIANQVSQLG